MSALADIAKSDGVIAAVRTTCDQWNDEGGCERAGDAAWCDLLRQWVGACVAVGRGATVMLDDGPAIRVRMSGTDVVAVSFVPGHKIVKSLSRMIRRVFKTRPGSFAAHVKESRKAADPIIDVRSMTAATATVMATAKATPFATVTATLGIDGPVPPGVVLW